jgi:hypothetical protein
MNNESIWMFGQLGQLQTGMVEQKANPVACTAQSAEQSERQTIDIYRAILRRLFGLHCLSGNGPFKPFMFILYSERLAHSAETPVFTEKIRRGITNGSGDLPVRIVWVEDVYGVGRGAEGEYIPDEGAVVQFDDLRRENAGLALVRGRIRRDGMEPRGFEYTIEKKGGFWLVKSSYLRWNC